LFLFTSMFTQAFTRFNGPITPIVILSVLVLPVPLCQSVFRSLSRGRLPLSDSSVSSQSRFGAAFDRTRLTVLRLRKLPEARRRQPIWRAHS
jgi:hypothetical protein